MYPALESLTDNMFSLAGFFVPDVDAAQFLGTEQLWRRQLLEPIEEEILG